MKAILVVFVLVILFSGCVISSYQNNKRMIESLPPSENIHSYEIDAMLRNGYPLIAVLGTGSMQPYIPSGDGIVAWCLVDRVDFDLLGAGDVVVYHHDKKKHTPSA